MLHEDRQTSPANPWFSEFRTRRRRRYRSRSAGRGRRPAGAEVFLGKQRRREVLREKGAQSRFLHIATHGWFRQDNPMFSSISLGDSHLNLFDLYQLDLPCELVTLSGCGTGLNMVVGGDELLGLVRGLLYAGAQSRSGDAVGRQRQSTAEFMKSSISAAGRTRIRPSSAGSDGGNPAAVRPPVLLGAFRARGEGDCRVKVGGEVVVICRHRRISHPRPCRTPALTKSDKICGPNASEPSCPSRDLLARGTIRSRRVNMSSAKVCRYQLALSVVQIERKLSVRPNPLAFRRGKKSFGASRDRSLHRHLRNRARRTDWPAASVNFAGLFDAEQALDRHHQFHSIIGREAIVAEQFLLHRSEAQDAGPPAWQEFRDCPNTIHP